MKEFNVLFWDFNTDSLKYYDVLPYFRDCYQEQIKKSKQYKDSDVTKTIDEFKKFIENKSKYRFWSRCEYELILCGWPVQKNEYKLDIHEQIMMNIDVITNILWDEIKRNNKTL